MNQQNLEYLQKQIKFTGFGETHLEELKNKISSGQSEFVIVHAQDFGLDNSIATLNFRGSEASDLYFFNSYHLMIKNEQRAEAVHHSFYINPKGDNITLKEGYNLLSGRAIQKEYAPREGDKYKAWFQLDFKDTDAYGQFRIKQFHPNYGFDLESSLRKHPLMELNSEESTRRLIESLERGNRQLVTYGKEGNQIKVFIEASPQFKSINFYDESFKRVLVSSLQAKASTAETQKTDTVQQSSENKLNPEEVKKKLANKVEDKVVGKQKRQKLSR